MLRQALLFGVLLACVADSFSLFNTRPGFAWRPASWLDNRVFRSFVESAARFGGVLGERNSAFTRTYGVGSRYTDFNLHFRLQDRRRCECVVTWDARSFTGGITRIIGGCHK